MCTNSNGPSSSTLHFSQAGFKENSKKKKLRISYLDPFLG